jgi:hypothetical protein
MKKLNEKLELIPSLSDEIKERLCKKSAALKKKAGAEILIDSIENETIQVSIKNVNGKRTGKYELFNYTYNLFTDNIPEEYRLVIKL